MIWILQYLRGTIDIGLVFDKEGGLDDCVIGFVDFDCAGDHDKRSLTSYVFTLSSCAISWKATLQAIVALSTTEVGYMAVTKAVKEDISLRGLLGELGLE